MVWFKFVNYVFWVFQGYKKSGFGFFVVSWKCLHFCGVSDEVDQCTT